MADDLLFPNGLALAPSGELIVAESFADRLTAFDLLPDGSLAGRRTFAEVPGLVPDGICLDAEGAVWAASVTTGVVVRVRPRGEIVDRRAIGSPCAYACALGGADGRTLFVCAGATGDEDRAAQERSGAIVTFRVDVPAVVGPPRRSTCEK